MNGPPNDPLENLDFFAEFLREYFTRHPAVAVRDLIRAALRRSRTDSLAKARHTLRFYLSRLRNDAGGMDDDFNLFHLWLPQLPDVSSWKVPLGYISPDVLVTYDRQHPGLPEFTHKDVQHCVLWSRPIRVMRGNADRWGFHYNDGSREMNLFQDPPADPLAAAARTISYLGNVRLPERIPFLAAPVVCAGRRHFDESKWRTSYGTFVERLIEE